MAQGWQPLAIFNAVLTPPDLEELQRERGGVIGWAATTVAK